MTNKLVCRCNNCPPSVHSHIESLASQTMAVEDLNIRLSLPLPHRVQRSSGPLSPGTVDIKQCTRHLRKERQLRGKGGGQECVRCSRRPRCHSPNNKVRHKKGAAGLRRLLGAAAEDKGLECSGSKEEALLLCGSLWQICCEMEQNICWRHKDGCKSSAGFSCCYQRRGNKWELMFFLTFL